MNQTEEFRKSPPAPLAPRSINLPNPVAATISNGLKVVLVEDSRLPIVSFRLGFKTGSVNDPKDAPGMTAFLASMLTEGTEKRTSRQIAEEVERIGGSLNASASADNTVISASALTIYNREILRLMADVVLNPSFPENELALAIQNTLQNLQYQRSQPNFLADERTSAVIYGEHPYSIVSATPEAVSAMTREKLFEFHCRMFVPDNAVLVVVGDVKQEQLLNDLEELFGSWEKGDVSKPEFAVPPSRNIRAAYVVDRPGSAQSNIVLANLAVNRNHPDYFPVLVMNQILGGGASSRLFMNLREEKGYTYGAYSSFDMRRLSGNFEATAEVRTDVTGASLKEFFYELGRIRNEIVPAEELQDIKNYMTGVFPLRLETQEGLINQLLGMQMYDLPLDFLETYSQNINAVTADEVLRVANQYVRPDEIAIVIVGDGEAIADQIKPFTENIEYFEASGKAKEMNKNMADAETSGAEETWNLTVASPMGNQPITMKFNRGGESLSGSLSTPMGDGSITGGTIDGNQISATASLSFQGMPVQVNINATIEGDSIRGSVSAPFPGLPELTFTGTRA